MREDRSKLLTEGPAVKEKSSADCAYREDELDPLLVTLFLFALSMAVLGIFKALGMLEIMKQYFGGGN